ncbi:hypothetical protein FHK92_08560 [Pseudomonas brassicacearum subsp. neoaurantiaca]|uniref:Uncharacterized protein n=1 Tax=Pseudomonas brassicacearum subsp. neoaurantiaca TaxID=494916 RepID=A0A7V8RJX8_9PSED|nr:hypothetical protein [Pseudomonas brassicacearum subsp. neoaurantiaca]
MSWIVKPYFLNLRSLDTLHPFFFQDCRTQAFPKCINGPFLFAPLTRRSGPQGPVNRSRSCLKSVIRV